MKLLLEFLKEGLNIDCFGLFFVQCVVFLPNDHKHKEGGKKHNLFLFSFFLSSINWLTPFSDLM